MRILEKQNHPLGKDNVSDLIETIDGLNEGDWWIVIADKVKIYSNLLQS
jgi:hypothetical protein